MLSISLSIGNQISAKYEKIKTELTCDYLGVVSLGAFIECLTHFIDQKSKAERTGTRLSFRHYSDIVRKMGVRKTFCRARIFCSRETFSKNGCFSLLQVF